MSVNKNTLSLAQKVNPKAKEKDVIKMTTLDFKKDAIKTYKNLLSNEHYGWGFMDANHNLFFNIHGTKFGQMEGFGAYLRPQDLGLILKNSNLIDSNVKSIYTISCYGGLQTPFTMDSGILVSSSHTSKFPIIGGIKDGISSLTSADGGVLVDGAKGLNTAKNIGVAITPEEFIDASKKYLELLPTLTANEAEKIYTYSKTYQIGNASYYYSQGYSKQEFTKIVDDKISHIKKQIDKLKNNPSNTSEKTIAEYEKTIKKLENYKSKKNINGFRKLDKEEEIIAKRYKKEAMYKDWEALSPEEKYEKYKNDYTKYKEERRQQWEERKKLEAEQKPIEETPPESSVKEETKVTIETEEGKGVQTETTSTKESTTSNSSKDQNNAEKVKKEEPINNPDEPKVNTKPEKPNKPEKQSSNKPEKKPEKKQKNKPNRKSNKPDSKLQPEKPNTKPETSEVKPDVETKPNTPETKPQVETQAKVKTPQPDKPKKPNYKPQRGPKSKSATVNATKEQIEKVVKETGMKTKKLAGDAAKAINWCKVGKVGAVVGVTALIGGGIYSHAKKEKKNRANGPDRLTGVARKSEFWNQSHVAQMAKDISTYQYGKRMTGFVQG